MPSQHEPAERPRATVDPRALGGPGAPFPLAGPAAPAPGHGPAPGRGPGPSRRPSARRWARALDGHRRWLMVGAAAVMLAGCASSTPTSTPKKTSGTSAPATTTSAPAASSTTTAPPGGPTCPLTGTPAPGGAVPQRPAVAVKVDNYPSARPQSGLDNADVVFEEPVEGRITRYVAVFQCNGASRVGPVRSARNIDIGILGQLGSPLLVHVGGIQPVLANINASPLVNVDLEVHPSIVRHTPNRVAPYSTYTSATGVWGLYPARKTPPHPLFTYSTRVPAGTAVSSVSIPFSNYANVVWRYDAQTHQFQRFYAGTPDTLANGVQNSATNVVVQFVRLTYGPWVEDVTGALEVQANLYQNASGLALVFRDGVEVAGTWSRSALGQPTKFTTKSGATISLSPGRTWVELVPDTINVTTTPSSSSAG